MIDSFSISDNGLFLSFTGVLGHSVGGISCNGCGLFGDNHSLSCVESDCFLGGGLSSDWDDSLDDFSVDHINSGAILIGLRDNSLDSSLLGDNV